MRNNRPEVSLPDLITTTIQKILHEHVIIVEITLDQFLPFQLKIPSTIHNIATIKNITARNMSLIWGPSVINPENESAMSPLKTAPTDIRNKIIETIFIITGAFFIVSISRRLL
jgi:hypothetical protein